MSGRKPRWRRALLLVGISLMLITLGLVTLPIWFPWLARPVARSLGFTFENYRSIGLTRVELTAVRGRIQDVEISAGRLEAFLPHRWLWENWVGDDRSQDYVVASNWTLIVRARAADRPPTGHPPSTSRVLDRIDATAQILRSWLPVSRLSQGTIRLEGLLADLPETVWRDGRLEVRAQQPGSTNAMVGRLETSRSGRWTLEARAFDLALETQFARVRSGWDLAGDIEWRSNRAGFTAHFDPTGWLPGKAEVVATNLAIRAEMLGLPRYGELCGRLAIHWSDGQYTAEANGEFEPDPATLPGAWSRTGFELKGHGDSQSATVDALQTEAAGLTLVLKEQATLRYSGWGLAEPAAFELSADLEDFRAGWQGTAMAEVQLRPASNTPPIAAFHVQGTDLSAGRIRAREAEAEGSLVWPRIELEHARLVLGANGQAIAHGTLDLQERELTTGVLELEGDVFRPFLPETMDVEEFKARVVAQGPLERLRHEGEVHVNPWKAPPLHPVAVSLRWNGEGTQTASFDAQVSAQDSRLRVEGQLRSFGRSLAGLEARVDTLTLERHGQAVYWLNKAAHLRWQQTEPVGWQAQVDGFAWRGEPGKALDLSVEVQWPGQSRVNLQADHVAVSEARDFWPGADRPVSLTALSLAAGWTNGPVDWRLEGEVRLGEPGRQRLVIDARARGDGSGTFVERLTVGGLSAPPLVGRGALPLVLNISDGDILQLLPDVPFEFGVSNQTADAVTVELSVGDRLELDRPKLDLRVTGTAGQPHGELRASVAGARWQSRENELALPRFGKAELEAQLRPDSIELNRLEFELDGQPVVVQGSWPLGDGAWGNLFTAGTVPDWKKASAHVLVQKAELEPLAQRLPALLTSQGSVHLDLTFRPGLMLDGFLSLTNAMTRPLGPLAPVREIEAMIAFSGRTARVDRFAGRLGGRPVHATGHATFGDTRELLYSLQCQATNVSVLREPGLLLRANLDLTLAKPAGQSPKIAGAVQLRDGLMLQDVSSLLVDRLERPALRPPYFSITNLPFANWQVDVNVTGDRFLRVRSPAFVGELSADGVVQGSLGKPVIRGDFRVPRGRILFPFGRLEVEGAYATLSGEDPRGPVLDLVAAGQNYNYNVRLEASGTMDDLNVLFTSTPPLSSEEILLMLTAGELPNRELTYSAQARAGRLATYLGREAVTRFFGNELGEERLIISAGEHVARSGRTTYSIEYRLTPRWSLVGEYDQFNALNAGFKWRLYAR